MTTGDWPVDIDWNSNLESSVDFSWIKGLIGYLS